jgi:hypothetical protein
MLRRFALLVLLAVCAVAQKYVGPRPPQSDLPYIKHASDLIATEPVVAREQDKNKSDIIYAIEGAASPAVTPLASPIFLLQASKMVPEKLQLFKLDVKGGHREVRITARKTGALRLEATRYAADTLWKIEVQDSLDPGEYALSQADDPSNRAFCFRVR